MNKIKKTLQLIKYNLFTIISFELLFKTIMIAIFIPIYLKTFFFIMQSLEYTYFTLENIIPFILNPSFIMLIISIIFLIFFIAIFEFITLTVIFDMSNKNKKINLTDSIKLSLIKCKNIKNVKSLSLLLLMFIVFIIFIYLSIIGSIKILNIKDINCLFYLPIFLVFILVFISFRFIYNIHYQILDNISYKQSKESSNNLIKYKDSLFIFLFQFIILIINFIIVLIGIKIISINSIESISDVLILIIPIITFIITSMIYMVISTSSISSLYYIRKKEEKEKIINISLKNIENKNKHLKSVIMILMGITFIIDVIFIYEFYNDKYNVDTEYIKFECIKMPEITGHRGTNKYPENTMSAFEYALKMDVDWIELDVQQTSDGKIIVIHDYDFFRTAGVFRYTWDLSYDEVKNLDAGSYLDYEFQNERIPLFEDVIKWAKKNNIKLNIELKPNRYQNDLETKTVDIIKKYNYEKNSVLTSQNYKSIKKVKEYDSNITTVFVTRELYDDVENYTYADHFSINESSVTPNLINEIHEQNKQIYVWTVDNLNNIKKFIDLKVDNIVTNNIEMAKTVILLNREVKSKKVIRNHNVIKDYTKLVKKYFNK